MQERKETQIAYVIDGFGNESWHYAASEVAAKKAHKFHFFGGDGLTKSYAEEPRVVMGPTLMRNVVCLSDSCCNFAGVPKSIAAKLVENTLIQR
jgi:hypothetical protein